MGFEDPTSQGLYQLTFSHYMNAGQDRNYLLVGVQMYSFNGQEGDPGLTQHYRTPGSSWEHSELRSSGRWSHHWPFTRLLPHQEACESPEASSS